MLGQDGLLSESQKDKLHRMVAEVVEARQHTCDKCGHPGTCHAFDIYPVDEDSETPCWRSCTMCLEKMRPT